MWQNILKKHAEIRLENDAFQNKDSSFQSMSFRAGREVIDISIFITHILINTHLQ